MFDTATEHLPSSGTVEGERLDARTVAGAIVTLAVLSLLGAWAAFWGVVVWFQVTSGGVLEAVTTTVVTQGLALAAARMLLFS